VIVTRVGAEARAQLGHAGVLGLDQQELVDPAGGQEPLGVGADAGPDLGDRAAGVLGELLEHPGAQALGLREVAQVPELVAHRPKRNRSSVPTALKPSRHVIFLPSS
jgi:hypothetical protein